MSTGGVEIASVIRHRPSFAAKRPSGPSAALVIHHSSFVISHSSFVIRHQSFVILLLFLLSLSACHQQGEHSILPPDAELRPGDLVFRLGGGLTSRAITTYDRGGRYSYVGLVVDSAGQPMVIHAVPDEHDSPSDSDRVKMDRPEVFFDTYNALSGAVARHADAQAARRATAYAWRAYRRRAAFDHDYDLADTTRLYCCELVIQAFREAGAPLTLPPQHNVNAPWFHIDSCYFPSDLYAAPELRTLYIF